MDPALVLPLGLVFVSVTYGVGAIAGLPWLFPLASLAAAVDLVLLRRTYGDSPSPPLRGALAPIAAIVALLWVTEYRQNRVAADGAFVVDRVDPEDQAFHAGLAFELSHSYPPQVPGLSGTRLHYHLGWPFVRAAAVKWAGVSPYDLMSRFDVTLGAIALVLALRSIASMLGGSALAVAAVPWTLVLCGYSWVLAAGKAEWWFTALPGEILPHLFHANSVIPALSIGLGALLGLGRAEHGSRANAVVAVVLAAALPFFKVFLAAQILGGLLVALLVVRKRGLALAAVVPMAIGTLLLVTGADGAERIRLSPYILGPITQTRTSLGLPALSGASAAGFALVWLVLSLGPRLFAAQALVRGFRSRFVPAIALATAALLGWPMSLLFQIRTAEPYARLTQANDALYFMDQSGPLLWLFAILTVAGWSSRLWKGAALAAIALCAVSTVQFVAHKALLDPVRMPAGIVRAMDVLRRDAQPGDVVIQTADPKRYPPPPLVLVPLRIPYTRTIPYLTQFASRSQLDRRLDLVRRFFDTDSAAEAREIARLLGARFFCLYGSERVRFDLGRGFRLVYSEANVSVYEIVTRG